MFNIKDFYPTPDHVISKMLQGIEWRNISSILEPSAGKGDLCNGIAQKIKFNTYGDNRLENAKRKIDTIEINPMLQHILKGEGYRVVHDDFLTFSTFKKYDLIVANFPFSDGEKHLNKALELQKDGGSIVCLIGAETIKNLYSKERKVLYQTLLDNNAEIDFLKDEFVDAERKTNVEVALVKVSIPKLAKTSFILEGLKQEEKQYKEFQYSNTEISKYEGFLQDIIFRYNMEVKLGVKIIQEYETARPYMMSEFSENGDKGTCLLNLSIGSYSSKERYNDKVLINDYIRAVRKVYWKTLFDAPLFVEKLTSNLQYELQNKIESLMEFDFSMFNIKSIQLELNNSLIKGIEDTILALFEEFSNKYHYYNESSKNMHLFNGWKTNKAYKINKKVIIPLRAFNQYDESYEPNVYSIINKLRDIEKVFDYLDGDITESIELKEKLDEARKNYETKRIDTKYFYISFFKKGTMHLEFKNEKLLDKFNIFGCQKKNWIPPSYGKKRYEDMTSEEKDVVLEFGTKEQYQEVIKNNNYYIFSASDIKMIGA